MDLGIANKVFDVAPISFWAGFFRDETGQDLIEYALVACLVGLAAVASIKNLGVKLASILTGISSSVSSSI